MKMRICLLGDFKGSADEGMKNISRTIQLRLSTRHEILAINSREFFKISRLKRIKSFDPHIIHYLHGPTIRSLFLLKTIKMFTGLRARTIASAVRPYFSKFSSYVIRALKPDLVLTQSYYFEKLFKSKGCNVTFFPNGVDCAKFQPATAKEKYVLRKQLNLPPNMNIILHVGHIKKNRNLEILKKIQSDQSFQVVMVGSASEKIDNELLSELKTAGVYIFQQYFSDITKFYQLADLYLFPVKSINENGPESYNQMGSIDLPLSVLEAMACNLPVVTTSAGALRRLFRSGEGLFFCDTESAILPAIREGLRTNSAQTRNKVLPLNWESNISLLEKIYKRTLDLNYPQTDSCLN